MSASLLSQIGFSNDYLNFESVGSNVQRESEVLELLHPESKVSKYNLTDLRGTPRSQSQERDAEDYISSVIPGKYMAVCDESVEEWPELPAFECSTLQRPDVSFMTTLDGGHKVTILLVEVHSGTGQNNYLKTATKLTIGLVTHLRYLRSLSNINQVIGFTFPRNDEQTFVTKVVVSWKQLAFSYQYTWLKMNEVSQELLLAIERNEENCKPILQSRFPDYFPIRLTEEELVELSEFSPGHFVQEEGSRHALIFSSEDRYYKYSHRPTQSFLAMGFARSQAQLANFPLGCTAFFDKSFLMYDKLEKPLKPDQAKKCLTDLLRQTAKAIEGLHGIRVAHMDIRLENICFKRFGGGYAAVLIDLDECVQVVKAARHRHRCVDSCMYMALTPTADKTCKIFDWLQLGWLALWVLWGWEEQTVESYHKMQWEKVPKCYQTVPFIQRVMMQGLEVREQDLFGDPWDQHKTTVNEMIISRQQMQ